MLFGPVEAQQLSCSEPVVPFPEPVVPFPEPVVPSLSLWSRSLSLWSRSLSLSKGPLSHQEALRIEPRLAHPLVEVGAGDAALLGVVGEGTSVHCQPAVLVGPGSKARMDSPGGTSATAIGSVSERFMINNCRTGTRPTRAASARAARCVPGAPRSPAGGQRPRSSACSRAVPSPSRRCRGWTTSAPLCGRCGPISDLHLPVANHLSGVSDDQVRRAGMGMAKPQRGGFVEGGEPIGGRRLLDQRQHRRGDAGATAIRLSAPSGTRSWPPRYPPVPTALC